jgi:succinoglycan biosynthesis protein ExoA
VSEGLVSVITPVRDEAALLRETAATILAQDWPAVEFLFVDGASQDGSRELLHELASRDGRVCVLDNPAGDLGSALAIGLAAGRGEFVAKLDAHTYFPPGYLRAGVERLRRGDVAWVSGPPVPFGVDPTSRRVALALGTWLGVGGAAKWAHGSAGDQRGGASSDEIELDTGVFSGIWRRDVLLGFGGWDPDWPVNEDSELASRFQAAGERIVCLPSMAARYVPRRSLRGLFRQYWRYGFYRAKTAGRHPDSLRRSQMFAPAVVTAFAVFALGGRPGRRLAAPALVAYTATLALASATTARGRDAALLPPVYAAMHLGWGSGFIAGCARFGIPTRALAALLRRGRPRPVDSGTGA